MTDWTNEELEDLFADAIGDSLDMDWQPTDGARAVMEVMHEQNLKVVEDDSWQMPVWVWGLIGLFFAAIIFFQLPEPPV